LSDSIDGKVALVLLKLSPYILLTIAVAAIILRSVDLVGNLTTSIVLAIVILSGIAIGVHRSANARKARSAR
jgi:hypothetical protein